MSQQNKMQSKSVQKVPVTCALSEHYHTFRIPCAPNLFLGFGNTNLCNSTILYLTLQHISHSMCSKFIHGILLSALSASTTNFQTHPWNQGCCQSGVEHQVIQEVDAGQGSHTFGNVIRTSIILPHNPRSFSAVRDVSLVPLISTMSQQLLLLWWTTGGICLAFLQFPIPKHSFPTPSVTPTILLFMGQWEFLRLQSRKSSP